MRQARYSHALKREAQGQKPPTAEDLLEMEAELAESSGVREAWGEAAEPNKYEECEGEENQDPYRDFVPGHLRDHHPLTTRQERQKKSTKPRVYGSQRPVSTEVGHGAWSAGKERGVEVHHKLNATKYFKDKGHVGIPDAPGNAPFVSKSAVHYRTPKH